MRRTCYIDVDDTIIAECYPGSWMDLRPGVMTQLTVLSKLFDCCWLTHWPQKDINELMRKLYGGAVLKNFRYADWKPLRTKAVFVLKDAKDFYWLEDPNSHGSLEELRKIGMEDRYITVNPKGNWGFIEAVNKLFVMAGITDADLSRVAAQREWFLGEFETFWRTGQ